jgi:release factor glutamine methyltransferase
MAAVSTPTPELPFSRAEYAHIYEPAEDTFLLLDALDADAALLRDGSRRLCVEIGCACAEMEGGSGEADADSLHAGRGAAA